MMIKSNLFVELSLIILLLAACTQYPEACPSFTRFDLSGANHFPADESLPFQFPVDGYDPKTPTRKSSFVAYGKDKPDSATEYHAAEDSFHPAGTPVYAMADGHVSFSGPAGGYGWLIIIDHPQANLYSLYGHLSPSRWKMESGTQVKKGDLIAYLGDPDENGGSAENPLVPHLHFGLRAGQRGNYPSRGEWRFMAGWIRLCPQDLGWLQPSMVIPSQEIPAGGYTQPEVSFLVRWGGELLLLGIYTIGGVGMLVFAIRKKSRFFLLFPGIILMAAGIVFHNNGMTSTYILLGIGMIVMAIGFLSLYRSFVSKPPVNVKRHMTV